MRKEMSAIYNANLPILENSFAEMDEEFTTFDFCDKLRENGVDEKIIRNSYHLMFLGKICSKVNKPGYSRTYSKKAQEKPINFLPDLKAYTDKQLTQEIESRGYTVLIAEVKYIKPNF
jgi:hypothetical protein